jgi:hypothetical protein
MLSMNVSGLFILAQCCPWMSLDCSLLLNAAHECLWIVHSCSMLHMNVSGLFIRVSSILCREGILISSWCGKKDGHQGLSLFVIGWKFKISPRNNRSICYIEQMVFAKSST